MKKILYSVLIALTIEQTTNSISFNDPSVLMAFSKRANLTDEELNAGLKLANNTPSKDKPFDLSIQSKEKEICYELKNNGESLSNCIDKKRAAELLIAYIQVCIEKKLEEELKKAQEMLHQLLNASQGSSISIVSNNDSKEVQAKAIINLPGGQFSGNLMNNLDPQDPSLTKTHVDYSINTPSFAHKANADTVRKKVTKENKNCHISWEYDKEISCSAELNIPKEKFSEKISITNKFQPSYDSKDNQSSNKATAVLTIESPETGPVTFTAEHKQEGKSLYEANSETQISLITENSQTNAEWCTDKDDEITSHNVASKYKKPDSKK